jgi:hypothetical protein
MTDLSAADTARALAAPVNVLGGKWMLDGDVLGAGTSNGYPNGFAYYVAGRGGVLGDVDADVVTAAFGYFAPGSIRSLWSKGVAVEGGRAAAARYGAGCAAWGRQRLEGFAGAERLADLSGRLVDSVDPAGLSLFAGWRAEVRPDDAPARAYLLLHVMRELRGSVHIIATTASGLSPLESILTNGASGAAMANMFGWSEPFPDVSSLADKRHEAESLTDALMARHLEVGLTGTERAELVDLIAEAEPMILG